MPLVKSLLVGTLVGSLAVGVGAGAGTAEAVDPEDITTTSSEFLPLEGTIFVASVEGPTDVRLPDGSVLRFPTGTSMATTASGTQASLPTGEQVAIPLITPGSVARAGGSYYPPVTIIHSRSQVETVHRAVNNIGAVCRWGPLPYLASIGCTASTTVKNAYTQAHYQSKRVRVDFYRSKVCSSCSYSKYTVVK